MMRKTPERVAFDRAIDDLLPYLPQDYGVRIRAKYPDKEIDLERLWRAVRKRGTTPDWESYTLLTSIKQDRLVERKPRKKHKPRTINHQLRQTQCPEPLSTLN